MLHLTISDNQCIKETQYSLCVIFNKVLNFQVFLVRKIIGPDAGTLYAMKVLKKATLKGKNICIKYYIL